MRDDTPRERLRQARTLRQEMTIAEAILWKHLRGRGLLGMKFRRQVPIGPYIADFACVSERLIIELETVRRTKTPNGGSETRGAMIGS
jgi:very-short-patch-repair endonuclease